MVSRPQAMTFSTDLQIQNIPAMIDLQWLLTGKGDMLKTKSSQSQKTGGNNPNSTGKDNNNSSLNQTFTTDIVDKFLAIIKNKDEKQSEVAHSAPENSPEGIPLIPLSAMAGAFTGETSVMEYECERYVIPAFKGADFLIQVKGDSMRPPYYSGDLVACQRVPMSDLFFQWNKVYVIDTNQGALVKRIKPGSDRKHLLIVSDNEKYDPFELPISSIHAVALVIGVIRLE